MAAPPGKPAAKVGGGKTGGKGPKASRLYTVSADKLTRKNKQCPKCGPGYYLSSHKDRQACGHCQYTEFVKK